MVAMAAYLASSSSAGAAAFDVDDQGEGFAAGVLFEVKFLRDAVVGEDEVVGLEGVDEAGRTFLSRTSAGTSTRVDWLRDGGGGRSRRHRTLVRTLRERSGNDGERRVRHETSMTKPSRLV